MKLTSDKPASEIASDSHQFVNGNLPYADYGYIPGVAQAAQNGIYPNPHLNPQPYFTQRALEAANWFTTRVHLSPIGSALNDEN